MKKVDFKKLCTTVEGFTKKNSPAILTGIGVAGIFTTTLLTGKATIKAVSLIHEREIEESKEELTKKEIIQTVWKEYIPVVITGGISIACVIGANSISSRRNAALATAYQITQTAFSDYKQQVISTVGEKKHALIEHKVQDKKVQEHPMPEDSQQLLVLGDDEQLCYDCYSDRYFKANARDLDAAENTINKLMLNENYISLNEAYSEMGVPPLPKNGEYIGWNVEDNYIHFKYGSSIAPNGKTCLTITFDRDPKPEFNMFG